MNLVDRLNKYTLKNIIQHVNDYTPKNYVESICYHGLMKWRVGLHQRQVAVRKLNLSYDLY